MPDLISALQLSAPEASLAVGGLVLLMIGAFAGNRAIGLVSGLSVALLISATFMTVTGPLGQAFNGAYVADPLAVYGKALIFLSSAVAIVLGDGWMKRVRIARFEYPVLIVPAEASTIRIGYSKRAMRMRRIQPSPSTTATALDRKISALP